MKILFRADSSSNIGTGHIMRDLVLAEQFKETNIIFATQDLQGNINHKILESNYSIIPLESNNFEELDQIIKRERIDIIVIDHYGINYNFEKKLKESNPNLKIFVLDDTYEKHYCDILLNHNISGDVKKYKNLVPENCELRCGNKYTLLRGEFYIEKNKKIKRTLNKEKSIFIAMGGSDPFGYNFKILKKLKKYNNIKVHLATTNANKNLNKLKRFAFKNKWIELHINSNKIAQLMNQSDFCIATPSVTISEILFLKKPFIAIKVIENQNDMYRYLRRKRYFAIARLSQIDKYIRKLIHDKR